MKNSDSSNVLINHLFFFTHAHFKWDVRHNLTKQLPVLQLCCYGFPHFSQFPAMLSAIQFSHLSMTQNSVPVTFFYEWEEVNFTRG